MKTYMGMVVDAIGSFQAIHSQGGKGKTGRYVIDGNAITVTEVPPDIDGGESRRFSVHISDGRLIDEAQVWATRDHRIGRVSDSN